jgi:hypothetical protein
LPAIDDGERADVGAPSTLPIIGIGKRVDAGAAIPDSGKRVGMGAPTISDNGERVNLNAATPARGT